MRTTFFLADGMPSPGISWQLGLLIFAALIAVVTGVARWFGAPRWLAVCIPVVPLGIWFGYTLIFRVWARGEGGAVPMVFLTGPLFGVGLVTSLVTVRTVPKRK